MSNEDAHPQNGRWSEGQFFHPCANYTSRGGRPCWRLQMKGPGVKLQGSGSESLPRRHPALRGLLNFSCSSLRHRSLDSSVLVPGKTC